MVLFGYPDLIMVKDPSWDSNTTGHTTTRWANGRPTIDGRTG